MGNALGYTAAAGVAVYAVKMAINAMGTSEKEDTMDFYYYAKDKAVYAIRSSGFIKERLMDDPHAYFGQGVYLTRLPPKAGKTAIARNNWGKNWHEKMTSGRVDKAIRVTIPVSKVEDYSDHSRDIFIHRGQLMLKDYKWSVENVL